MARPRRSISDYTLSTALSSHARRALLVYAEAVRVMARSVRQAEAKVASDASKVAPARPFLVLMTEAGREVVWHCRRKFIIASVRLKKNPNSYTRNDKK